MFFLFIFYNIHTQSQMLKITLMIIMLQQLCTRIQVELYLNPCEVNI
jgi:hypothetical protein